MTSHYATPEARARATKKYWDNNRDKLNKSVRDAYYNNPEARQKKLDKSKQRVYVEGTIRFIRLLYM